NEGQWNMFDMGEPEPIRLPMDAPAWSTTERADRELSAIGFHLSAHPLDAYADLFEKLRVQRWGDFERAVKDGAPAGRLAGTMASRNDRRTKKGTPMMILSLSDQSGDRKSTRLNSSHVQISYAVFCLKKKRDSY